MKRQVKIRFQNGLLFKSGVDDILAPLKDEFEFIDSDNPDVIVFGPYGNDVPPKGNYIRVGYYCENITPDLSNCEWCFGIPHEAEVNSQKYKRIQWHGVDPTDLIKKDWDAEKILASKTGFCNFLYSHKVPYREEFFKQLSKYKKVDAPGKSMNNMPSIDSIYAGDIWSVKRQFASSYKFTIAFENYVYPGYQTEKLYDAMLCKSLPIYCGDINIDKIFNTKSFVNAADYVELNNTSAVTFFERNMQMSFRDVLPQFHSTPLDKLRRKIKAIGRVQKMRMQFNKLDFSPLIDRIIAIDKEPALYIQYLNEPWFCNNTPPQNLSSKQRWTEIFESIS